MLLSSQCIQSKQITMAATHSSNGNGIGEGKTHTATEMERLTTCRGETLSDGFTKTDQELCPEYEDH